MRPGLANAFLVGFIESIADFGNPIVLGGNFGVLSTEIFFAVVGAQLDQGRAAALGAAAAGLRARRVLRCSAASSARAPTPPSPARAMPACRRRCPIGARRAALCDRAAVGRASRSCSTASPSSAASSRRGAATTRRRCATTSRPSRIERAADGLIWSGAAWNSFWTTVKLAADRRAAHRRARPARRLAAGAPALRRPRRVRVRHHAVASPFPAR